MRKHAPLAALTLFAALLLALSLRIPTTPPGPCTTLPTPPPGYDYVRTGPTHDPGPLGIWHHRTLGDIYGYATEEDSPIYPTPLAEGECNP